MSNHIGTCRKCGQSIELIEPSHVDRQRGDRVRFRVLNGDARPPCDHLPAGWPPLVTPR